MPAPVDASRLHPLVCQARLSWTPRIHHQTQTVNSDKRPHDKLKRERGDDGGHVLAGRGSEACSEHCQQLCDDLDSRRVPFVLSSMRGVRCTRSPMGIFATLRTTRLTMLDTYRDTLSGFSSPFSESASGDLPLPLISPSFEPRSPALLDLSSPSSICNCSPAPPVSLRSRNSGNFPSSIQAPR